MSNRPQMYIKWDKDNYEYFLPQFSHMRERLIGFYDEKSQKEKVAQEEWKKKWTDRSRGFRLSDYANHYIIDMPLLTDGLFVDIICRLATRLLKKEEGVDPDEGIPSDNIAVGADGLIAWWGKSEKYEVPICLLVDGVTAAPGRFQIFVGPGEVKDSSSSQEFDFQHSSEKLEKLMKKLEKIRDHAFEVFFDATSENIPLMVNMRTYLVLPNHYLAAQQGALGGRLALRDVYHCKKSGKDTYDYIEGSLPMERLEKFIPERYVEELEKVLNM